MSEGPYRGPPLATCPCHQPPHCSSRQPGWLRRRRARPLSRFPTDLPPTRSVFRELAILKAPLHKQSREQGFTLLEVLIAIFVLTIGVMGMALLGARMMATGQQSKYMSVAATLSSEKLEDLNRWDGDDPPTG